MWMQQPVLPNHARPGIAEDDELAAGLLVPDKVGIFLIVHADRHQARFRMFEFIGMLRELAQLAYAERSPVSAIEHQHDAGAMQA